MAQSHYQLILSSARPVRNLSIIVVALLGIHSLLQVWHYEWQDLPWPLRQLFDVDEEDSIPTWYSATALSLAAGLLFIISRIKRIEGDSSALYWYGLTVAFALLSLDEIAGFHETLNSMVDYSWAIPGGIAAAIFGLAYLRFLWRLPPQTRWLFILAGAVFIGGAVGVEMYTDWYADEDLLNTLAYNLWTAIAGLLTWMRYSA